MGLFSELDTELTSCDATEIVDTGGSTGKQTAILKKDTRVPTRDGAAAIICQSTISYARADVAAGNRARIRDVPGTDNEDAIIAETGNAAELCDRACDENHAIVSSSDGRSRLNGNCVVGKKNCAVAIHAALIGRCIRASRRCIIDRRLGCACRLHALERKWQQ